MVQTLSPQQRIKKIRRLIYIFVITIGLFNIFCPFVVHADIFNNEVQDVYVEITENVAETNDILNKAFKFCQVSPYRIINDATYMASPAIAVNVHNACKTVALVVATLLLMIDFFRKSTNFEWASKWENILVFLIKVVVVKVIVCNTDVIVGYIYSGFNYINTQATGGTVDFLPYGTTTTYKIRIKESLLKSIWDSGFKGWWDYWKDLGAGSTTKTYDYIISEKAVKIFYPKAVMPPDLTVDFEAHAFENPTNSLNFNASIEIILLQAYFLVMKAIAYIIFVIAIGRIFELCIYILMAPLPLATFASDTTHDVAKSFIKNFIATILQIAVIVLMFVIYTAVTKFVNNEYPNTPVLTVVTLISLGLGVMKSGTWSRKLCGLG